MNPREARLTGMSTKILDQAAALFAVKPENVPACLSALGLTDVCSRCGGSGHYSYNQIDGSRCYGCNGRGKKAAKLTKAVFAAAQEKVAAGELEAVRAVIRAKKAARKEIAPLVAAAKDVYATIAQAYEVAYQASMANYTRDEEGNYVSSIPKALHRAQEMNNSIYWSYISATLESDVRMGRRTDYPQVVEELKEAVRMLETLRLEWQLFNVTFE
jgi:hypothetical protein